MISLHYDVDGDAQLARGLSRFGEDCKDLRPAFKQIATSFRQIEAKQFSSQGGYGSGGWTALRASTIARKERGGYPMDILVRTGALRDSLIERTSGTVIDIQPLKLSLGTSVPHAIFHQRGTRHMQARPLIQLTEGDKRDWMKMLQRYLVGQARKRIAPAAGQPGRVGGL